MNIPIWETIAMFVHMSIHKPRAAKEEFLIDSMHRFVKDVQGRPGLPHGEGG
jgi:hypothetical protein